MATVGRGAVPFQDIDGVLIASPGPTHAELALPYIERGVATFIEKPMATSNADAERLRAAAGRSGAAVFVGHIYLYNPAFRRLLDLLPALGAIRHVQCEGMNNNPAAAAPVIWEWLPHHLSMGQEIFGTHPASVSAWSLSDGANPRAAVTQFLFGSTPLVSITSWLSPVRRRAVTIPCENGTIVFDDAAERKLALHAPSGGVSYPGYEPEPPLTRELRAFLDAVRSGAADRDHLAEGCSIVRSIAAAEESIRNQGAPVVL